MTDDDDRKVLSERAQIAPDADVPEEIEERLKKEREGGPELDLEEATG